MKLWMGPLSGRREPRNDFERRMAAADEQAGPVRRYEQAWFTFQLGWLMLSLVMMVGVGIAALISHLLS